MLDGVKPRNPLPNFVFGHGGVATTTFVEGPEEQPEGHNLDIWPYLWQVWQEILQLTIEDKKDEEALPKAE